MNIYDPSAAFNFIWNGVLRTMPSTIDEKRLFCDAASRAIDLTVGRS
jgi:hypothetical protein